MNDYGIRFTEEKYASKNEVAKELKISMIDAIWSPILKYRSTFNRYLTLKNIEHNSLVVCFSPTISDSFNELDKKFTRLMSEYLSYSKGNNDNSYSFHSYLECLKNIVILNKGSWNEQRALNVIKGYSQNTEEDLVIKNYYSCLKYLDDNRYNQIDSTFILELYRNLMNDHNISSIYRDGNNDKTTNRVLIDRVYTSAPVNMIKPMMDSLLYFIDQSSISTVIKSLIAFYYINYVKPFHFHNEEMSILICKAILAHDQLGSIALFVPLEKILNEKSEESVRACNEVQKTNDLTYFLIFVTKSCDKILQRMIDELISQSSTVVKEDFFNEEKQVEKEVEVPNKDITETTKHETIEPIVKEVEKPKVQPVSTFITHATEEKSTSTSSQERIAMGYIPPVLDEKEAQRLEDHLLECDPLLSKKQAKFYARHCTLGKMYTIQQFKKYNNCVYETARVGMDTLVALGYYKKEQIKNKFVYTPIEKK